eukprot:3517337-Alexandrium_andersonii.AAC.1
MSSFSAEGEGIASRALAGARGRQASVSFREGGGREQPGCSRSLRASGAGRRSDGTRACLFQAGA